MNVQVEDTPAATTPHRAQPAVNSRPVNISSVRHISPFRYPGGKTWLVPTIVAWLKNRSIRPSSLVDPFTGGGSIPLSLLREDLTDRIILGDIDPGVGAVWECILSSENSELRRQIRNFTVSRETVVSTLEEKPDSRLGLAFQPLLRNRTSRGGILAPGSNLLMSGEKGRGVASRWYPVTLDNRLSLLDTLRPRIEFTQGDAFSLIEKHMNSPDAAFFIDPPYTAGEGKRAGRRLYKYNDIDHDKLFSTLKKAAGLVLMTYDDCPEVIELAGSSGFQFERVSMRNTHHVKSFELLISNFAEYSTNGQSTESTEAHQNANSEK